MSSIGFAIICKIPSLGTEGDSGESTGHKLAIARGS
ncbi:hypothetical protein A2U01_0100217, partial [Trifolium medium]|nr:hypothetical protein [Trifolium medium]